MQQAAQDEFVAAVKAKDLTKVRAMLAREPGLVAARGPVGIGILQLAVYLRASQVVDALLAAGAQPDVWATAALGDTARVRALVAADLSLLQGLSADGFTPLHLAAHFGKLDTVRALLVLGADVHAMGKGMFGNTALHAAAAGGHLAVCEQLLKAGAKADARDAHDFTPLHNAAAVGSLPLAELLLRRGAMVDAKGDDGRTPLSIAEERENRDVADLLRKHGAKA